MLLVVSFGPCFLATALYSGRVPALGSTLCAASFEVECWRLKRQLSQLEEPVSEYGHPDGSNADSDRYGRGRPHAMKNFRHGVLLFVFDTPAMMEVPLPAGCLIRRISFNHAR